MSLAEAQAYFVYAVWPRYFNSSRLQYSSSFVITSQQFFLEISHSAARSRPSWEKAITRLRVYISMTSLNTASFFIYDIYTIYWDLLLTLADFA